MFEEFESSIAVLREHLKNALNNKKVAELKVILGKFKDEHSKLLSLKLPDNGDGIIFTQLKNCLLRLIFLSHAFLKEPGLFQKCRLPLLDYILDDDFDQDYYHNFLKLAFLDNKTSEPKGKCPLFIIEETPGYIYAVIETLYLTANKLKLHYTISRSTIMALTSVGLLIRNTSFYTEKEFHIIRLDAHIQKLGIGSKLMQRACADTIKNPSYKALEFIAEKTAFGFYVKFFEKQYDIDLKEFIIQNFDDDACRIRISREHLILCQIKMEYRAAATKGYLLLCYSKDKVNTETIQPVQTEENEADSKGIKQAVKICKI